MTNNPDTIRQGDDAEYVYYTEEQLDEIVAEFVKEPADEEARRRKMIVLKLVCDLRNYRGWAMDEIELLKGLRQRTGDQLDAEIKTSAYLRKEVERLQEFELQSAELATEQRYAKEQAIKWNDYAAKLREDRRSLQAQLNAKDKEIAGHLDQIHRRDVTVSVLQGNLDMYVAECDRLRDIIATKDAQIAERDAAIAKMESVPGYGAFLVLKDRLEALRGELEAKDAALDEIARHDPNHDRTTLQMIARDVRNRFRKEDTNA